MGVLVKAILISLLSLFISPSTAKQYDPLVAFVCDRGAMHMSPEKGWYSDGLTNCLETKESILTYCKQTYPTLDIQNIVETTEHEDIKGWCPLGDSHCSQPETFRVQPYRCLVGDFQSDTLIVPEGCKFEHIHGSKGQCEGFDYWSSEASDYCDGTVTSYAMLSPCGTDLWSGVELVCCSDEEVQVVPKDSSSLGSLASADRIEAVEKYKEMKLSGGDYSNEHDAYELAKSELTKAYQQKMSKLLLEWSTARDNVLAKKQTDPKETEKLNKQVTDKYEREYLAIQNEEDIEMTQMDAIHQQRVQTNLNYKKRVSMQKLMTEMKSGDSNVEDITDLLERYIMVERKDADHCIKHFRRIEESDPRAAEDMRPATVERLHLISTRINQSIGLMDTLQDRTVAEKVKENTRKWLKDSSYDIDSIVKQLDLVSTDTVTNRPQTPAKVYVLTEESYYEADVEPEDGGVVNAAVEEEEMGYGEENLSAGAVVAIAAGIVAAMMVVVFAILIVKKKSSFRTRKFSNTYLEVASESPDISPEDRHIVAMQNGYENPTYALLEQRRT